MISSGYNMLPRSNEQREGALQARVKVLNRPGQRKHCLGGLDFFGGEGLRVVIGWTHRGGLVGGS